MAGTLFEFVWDNPIAKSNNVTKRATIRTASDNNNPEENKYTDQEVDCDETMSVLQLWNSSKQDRDESSRTL